MKIRTKKVYKKMNNKVKKQNNSKKHYKFNSAIIHPASIILPRK